MPPSTLEKPKPGKADQSEGKKATSAFLKPLQPSSELTAIVGSAPLLRPEVVSRVWEYIKKHKLQHAQNKRGIMADEMLQAVFGGKNKVSMFEMNKHLDQHWDREPEGALSLSRLSQGGGEPTLVECLVAQVARRAAKTCSLSHPLLIKQALDLTLQPRNSTFAALSPVLKGLSPLEKVGRMAEFDHLHTTQDASRREVISQIITSEPRLPEFFSREWECSWRSGF